MSKLTVAGLGIQSLDQMTLEAQRCVCEAGAVLYLGTTPKQHLHEIQTWGVKSITSIYDLYLDGDVDIANYERIYREVARVTGQNESTVLLVPGHPRIGVTIVQWLTKLHKQDGFDLKVLPGISSFDTMLDDLARDPLEHASVLVDANRMLLFETRWDPTFDCYLYHVCSVGTSRTYVSDPRRENDWRLLQKHLLTIYPASATVVLISSSMSKNQAALKLESTIEKMAELFPHVHFGTTLFIHGQKPKRVNRMFLQRLKEKEHEEPIQTA